MELRHVMRTTPATRAFTDDDLPDDVLYDILEHARFAPNGGNRQAWSVIVVRDAPTKRAIADLYDVGMREYAAQVRAGLVPFVAAGDGAPPPIDLEAARQEPSGVDSAYLATVPVLLLILLDTEAVSSVDGGLGRVPLTAGGSAFPFAHNVLLAARDVGYGGHLTSVLARQEPALRELLGIPEHVALATMLPLGRPAKEVTRLRRAPVESFTRVGSFAGPPFSKPPVEQPPVEEPSSAGGATA